MNLLNGIEISITADTGHFHQKICISGVAGDIFFPGVLVYLPCTVGKEPSAD